MMMSEIGIFETEKSVKMSLEFNLQFFAEGEGGEKTEPASEKKLDDARKEGQVAKSKEVASGLGLLALFLMLKIWIGNMGTQFIELFGGTYNRIPEIAGLVGGTTPDRAMSNLISFGILRTIIISVPVFIVAVVIAFLSDYIQVQWKPTAKPLKPKFSKLNPINGIKRIFSVNTLFELK